MTGTDVLELGLILVVAVGGKFVGAYASARVTGMKNRPATALAVLINTRGLTELIILSVGLQLGVLDDKLYSTMVVMALVTTAMAGPLLHLLYPVRPAQSIAPEELAVLSHAAGQVNVNSESEFRFLAAVSRCSFPSFSAVLRSRPPSPPFPSFP